MPSQPTAKNELKRKRKRAAIMPFVLPGNALVPASTAMEIDMPAAPNNMSGRRPNFSMVKTAIQDAAKYSVPLRAASRREVNGFKPMLFSKMVAA